MIDLLRKIIKFLNFKKIKKYNFYFIIIFIKRLIKKY
jgi:hypothetical protein